MCAAVFTSKKPTCSACLWSDFRLSKSTYLPPSMSSIFTSHDASLACSKWSASGQARLSSLSTQKNSQWPARTAQRRLSMHRTDFSPRETFDHRNASRNSSLNNLPLMNRLQRCEVCVFIDLAYVAPLPDVSAEPRRWVLAVVVGSAFVDNDTHKIVANFRNTGVSRSRGMRSSYKAHSLPHSSNVDEASKLPIPPETA